MDNKNGITPSIDYNEILLRAVAVIKQARALLDIGNGGIKKKVGKENWNIHAN